MIDGYLLGIDPSTACGFAVLRPDGSRVQSGAWRLHPRTRQGQGGRFVNLHDHLAGITTTYPSIVSIAYEVPGQLQRFDPKKQKMVAASPATYLGLFGIVAHVESWCERHAMHYRGFAPGEVKKLATGNGNANKAAVIDAMCRRFSLDLHDDNECDALAIALTGLAELGCPVGLQLEPTRGTKRPPNPSPTRDADLDEFYGDTP